MTAISGTGDLRSALGRVDEVFADFQAEQLTPGLAYGVIADGALVHSGGLGVTRVEGAPVVPDADSVFRIASMTKSFTATAIVLLRDRGQLNLDDPVSRYVPELADLILPTSDSPMLTIRHLLTMSGGLPTDDPWGDRQESLGFEAFSALLRTGFRFVAAPGVGFEYSNLGYAMLGRVIGNLAEPGEVGSAEWDGQIAYHRFVQTQLLDVLGLSASGYRAGALSGADAGRRMTQGHRRRDSEWRPVPFAAPGAFSSMGGLFSSVRDLSTWVLGLLDAFPARDDGPGRHPLSRASRREMQQQHRAVGVTASLGFEHPGPGIQAGSLGYGFGLFVEQIVGRGEVVSHSGGYPGYGSHMRWHPASGLGVIALGNATYAPMTRAARRAHDELLRLLDAPTHRQTSPWTDTTASVGDVERLALDTFDDSAADALLAENIDLDLPRVERKADLAHAVAVAGRIEMAEPPSLESDGPAHATWSRAGADGRLDFTIRMSPERETRVQTMLVAAVPTPPEPLWTAIRVLAGWLDAPAESGGLGASWPTKVRTGSEFSPEPFLRAASLARALGGPFELDSAPVSVDPAGRWTFALRTPSLIWHLVIGADIGGAGTMPALGSDREPAATVTVTHCSLSLVPLTSR